MPETFVYDFDAQFQKYLNRWINTHRDEYPTEDALEDALVEVYDAWLDKPAKWLGGIKPGEYFQTITDTDELLHLLERYINVGVSVPNMLLDAVSERGMEAEEGLLKLVNGEFSFLTKPEAQSEARLHAAQLLHEIGSQKPVDAYIRFICEHSESDECEVIAEALTAMGEMVRGPIYAAMDELQDAAAISWFLSVLIELPPQPRTLEALMEAFRTDGQRRAVYASFLSKYGSSKAVPVLKEVMLSQNLNYLEWIECRNAVEALGGVINFEMPDFTGDIYYESLKELD